MNVQGQNFDEYIEYERSVNTGDRFFSAVTFCQRLRDVQLTVFRRIGMAR